MTIFRSIKKVLDRSLELLVTVVVAVLVMDVLWQVFTRFVLKSPSTWTEELAVFMLIWVSLLGAAVALNRGVHLGIDYFVGKLSPRKKLYTEIFAFMCISIFSLTVMVIGGIDLVGSTLKLEQMSPALGIKVGYVYLAVPISGFFLVLYSAIGVFDRLVQLFRNGRVRQKQAVRIEEGVD